RSRAGRGLLGPRAEGPRRGAGQVPEIRRPRGVVSGSGRLPDLGNRTRTGRTIAACTCSRLPFQSGNSREKLPGGLELRPDDVGQGAVESRRNRSFPPHEHVGDPAEVVTQGTLVQIGVRSVARQADGQSDPETHLDEVTNGGHLTGLDPARLLLEDAEFSEGGP